MRTIHFRGSCEGPVGTVPSLSLGKDALDKTEGLRAPPWPGHRAHDAADAARREHISGETFLTGF